MKRLLISTLTAALFLVVKSPASCVADNNDPGCVHFEWKTSQSTDQYTAAPNGAQQQWLQDHFARITAYSPYWDSRLRWYPKTWFYQDSSALYSWDKSGAPSHPDWVLKNQWGSWLWVNFDCNNGACAQYAPDYSNPEFQAWWINKAQQAMNAGYLGVWIDDANLQINVSNGWNQDTPIDPHTGGAMTQDAWNQAITGFFTAVHNAFPGKQIVHNALWFSNGADTSNPYVAQEIAATSYLNLERGFADGGLTGDGSYWSIQHLFQYIDGVHAAGRNFIAHQYGDDGLFSLAAYFLVSNGADLFGNDAITPDNWPSKYDVELGSAKGGRYSWNGLIRRDFSNGTVMINPPGAGSVTVDMGGSYTDISGNQVFSLTLGARSGAVLLAGTSSTPTGPIGDGNYTIRNNYSGLVLDDPASAGSGGVQMIQWSGNGGSNQSWGFTQQPDGSYTIRNTSSGLLLTSPSTMGAGVTQETARNDGFQSWSLTRSGSGWVIANQATGWVLADPQGSSTQGAGMVVWRAGGYPDQVWNLL